MRIAWFLLKGVLLLGCLAWAGFWLLVGVLVTVASAGFGFVWGLALWYLGLTPLGWWMGHRLVKGIERRSNGAPESLTTDPETLELMIWG